MAGWITDLGARQPCWGCVCVEAYFALPATGRRFYPSLAVFENHSQFVANVKSIKEEKQKPQEPVLYFVWDPPMFVKMQQVLPMLLDLFQSFTSHPATVIESHHHTATWIIVWTKNRPTSLLLSYDSMVRTLIGIRHTAALSGSNVTVTRTHRLIDVCKGLSPETPFNIGAHRWLSVLDLRLRSRKQRGSFLLRNLQQRFDLQALQ